MTFVEGRGVPLRDYARSLSLVGRPNPANSGNRCGSSPKSPGDRGQGPALEHGNRMPGTRWFPGARLNFAENLLRGPDAEPAIVFRNERGDRRELSWRLLRSEVARVAAGLAGDGVGPGDVVAAFLPNVPETVIAMLAAASRGATFTSCSPDFGIQGVLDRFGQVEAEGPVRRGRLSLRRQDRRFAGADRRRAARARVRRAGRDRAVSCAVRTPRRRCRARCTSPATADAGAAARFERLPFDHPLYVLYSTGTTGVPKCIVHGAGGTLLQHLKEHRLHADLKPGDRLFFFTTCGWMMWNWLVSGLAAGATIVLYDGSPLHPGPEVLWQMAADEGVTHLRHEPALPRDTGEGRIPARRAARPRGPAHASVDRFSAGAGAVRLRRLRHRCPTSSSPRFPAAPTSFPASRSATRCSLSIAASCSAADSA